MTLYKLPEAVIKYNLPILRFCTGGRCRCVQANGGGTVLFAAGGTMAVPKVSNSSPGIVSKKGMGLPLALRTPRIAPPIAGLRTRALKFPVVGAGTAAGVHPGIGLLPTWTGRAHPQRGDGRSLFHLAYRRGYTYCQCGLHAPANQRAPPKRVRDGAHPHSGPPELPCGIVGSTRLR